MRVVFNPLCRALLRAVAVCAVICAAVFPALAEGTAQVNPYNSTTDVGMQISNISSVTSGPYKGAPGENRVRFYAHASGETFYFGIRAFDRPTAPNNPTEISVYWRILYQDGTPKDSGMIANNATNGRIIDYNDAVAGPSALGGTYNALSYDPDTDGEYYIEIYQSSDGGATATTNQNFLLAFFDFTVGDDNSSTPINGRVYSQGWSLITFYLDPTGTNTPSGLSGYPDYSGDLTVSMSEAVFYGYAADSTVCQITFHNFRPLAFVLYFNKYGADPVGGFTTTRNSTSLSGAATTLPGGYSVFLNVPDAIFQRSTSPSAPTVTGITGCPGNYKINVTATAPGDIQVLLDLDGTTGYTAGTADRYVYAYDVVPGTALVPWDGLDGLGNPVIGNVSVTSSAKILRGRTNLPLFDAELNDLGITVQNEALDFAPILYWNDANLTHLTNNINNCNVNNSATFNNNVTVEGNDFSIDGAAQWDDGTTDGSGSGTLTGNRGWDGDWLDGTTPKVQVTLDPVKGASTLLQTCDDYGNFRILNTWFWILEVESSRATFSTPSGSCVLPVTLIDFNAEKRGGTAQVRWNTANEVNFREFVVERSLNGRDFSPLGHVAARGSFRNSYTFSDDISSFNQTRIYYRLRQVDIDGSFTFSRVVTLFTDSKSGLLITGVVNPVRSNIQFQLSAGAAGNADIRISDATGRLVYRLQKEVLNGTNMIDLSSAPKLAAGTYLLSVESGNERVVEKLIVNR